MHKDISIENIHRIPSIQLVRMIGSPLEEKNHNVPIVESEELFNYAFQNRIGLLYLEKLDRNNCLNSLQDKYDQLRFRERETRITAMRASSLLKSIKIPHFVFMTLYPFSCVTNDVELINLGDKKHYALGRDKFLSDGYIFLEEGPDTIMLGDPRGADVVKPDKTGGTYYVDWGSSVSMDFFQFLDLEKVKLALQSRWDEPGYSYPVVDPKVELAAIITHTILEQRYGLEVYYLTAHLFSELDDSGIAEFADVVKAHCMKPAVAAGLSIAAQVHKDAFGNIPDKLKLAMSLVGQRPSEARNFVRQGRETQHQVSLLSFLLAVIGKLGEANALRSMIVQLLHMINPMFLYDVICSVIIRRRRGESHHRLM